ncbi:epsilon-sarcoglycan isoform X2 [Dendroctonus ponderosae]|uniref:epsilon-sarcoglycan isoform X2 n=1 Tax=Dendroctonus ponderosae TaxID=77166 RepID=UPI002034EB36|nr:epsilon-sarcoglycan isoform X2 [Dendroctonus ponderosae]
MATSSFALTWALSLLTVWLVGQAETKVYNVLETEVFVIELDASLFNWTYDDRPEQVELMPALANYADLPSWIYYVDSRMHQSKFLYGVPPTLPQPEPVVHLIIVSLNRHKGYTVSVKPIDIEIQEKLNPALYEVNMKIDNLNVTDMFIGDHMNALKEIFTRVLWKNTDYEIYVTFLKSALELGARKPLRPQEGEGVVIRLGSRSMFSTELLELQKEVQPLNKMQPCPRNFKRTSVERFFRDAGFILDWCAFHLIERKVNKSAQQKSDIDYENLEEFGDSASISFYRQNVPERPYRKELIIAIGIPMMIMTVLVVVLSFIICYKNDMADEQSEFFFENIFHICVDWYNERINISNELATYEEQSTPQRFLAAKNQTDPSLIISREQNVSPDGLLLSYLISASIWALEANKIDLDWNVLHATPRNSHC